MMKGRLPSMNEAKEILSKYVKGDFQFNHALIVSGIMGYFSEKNDPDNQLYWEVAGLLHDIDFELFPQEHCRRCRGILEENNIPKDMIVSIISHGYGILPWVTDPPIQYMEKILFATDELSGLISACALVRPSKSIADLELKSLKKKFKTPGFAGGCNREVIEKGAKMLDMELDELLNETLKAMKSFTHVYNN